jgi:hypothetical protein
VPPKAAPQVFLPARSFTVRALVGPFLILPLAIESGSRTLSIPDSLPGQGIRAAAQKFPVELERSSQVDSRSLFCFMLILTFGLPIQVLTPVILHSSARFRTSFIFLCRQDLILPVLTHCYRMD